MNNKMKAKYYGSWCDFWQGWMNIFRRLSIKALGSGNMGLYQKHMNAYNTCSRKFNKNSRKTIWYLDLVME